MEISFQLMDLIIAGTPLVIFLMGILGVLLKYTVLNPLNRITKELRRIEVAFQKNLHEHDTRIAVLETKEHETTKQLTKLINQLE